MKIVFALVLVALAALSQPAFAEGVKSVHVFVALADNKHQGIVPVPEHLGNGDDPAGNLYWGAQYGVKTFLKASGDWRLVSSTANPASGVLERCVFRHTDGKVVLVADAYKGSEIKQAISDFLRAAGGGGAATVEISGEKVPIHGGADLAAYVGHNGLMDFSVDLKDIEKGAPSRASGSNEKGREAIVLCCKSKPYFEPLLKQLDSRPVLTTTGLMAPEAYTLEAALQGWIAGEPADQIKRRAAAAYDKFQKCGAKAARRLFGVEE
jgi:hypothetical protein